MNKLMLGVCTLAFLAPLNIHGLHHFRAMDIMVADLQPAPGISRASSAPDIFMEDFEGAASVSASDVREVLPALGWTVAGVDPDNTFEVYFLQDLKAHSGRYYLYSPYAAKVPRDEWAVTPAVQLEAGKNYRFGVFVNIPGYRNVVDAFRVMAGSEPVPGAMDITVIDATGKDAIVTENDEWREMVARFSPEVSGQYFFGVNHCSPADGNYVAFDDLRISLIPEDGGEISFLRTPYFRYTRIPENWPLTTPMHVEYQVRNVGDNPLRGASVAVTASVGAADAVAERADVPDLEWDAVVQGAVTFPQAGLPLEDGAVGCRLELNDAEGIALAAVEAGDIPAPDRSTPWLARDNGEIAGYMSLSLFESFKSAARLGTRFQVVETTSVDAVNFALLGGYSTASSVIARIYVINRKGVVDEYAASRREQLTTASDGYTEYTLTFPAPVELIPGEYIVSLDEAAGEALGLALTSNYTGNSLAFTLDGQEWKLLPATPWIRLRDASDSAIHTGEVISSGLRVTALPSAFIIEGSGETSVPMHVFTPSGLLVYATDVPPSDASGCVSVAHDLSPGIYILRVASLAVKVAVP